jgi:hypothetical protein
MLGEGDGTATPDEIAWAFRKLLEAKRRREPLLCIFDDIQWGEETFLELIEHIADSLARRSHPLLCMARPELLDRRPAWAGGKLNATTVSLEPLSEDETDELIAGLLEGSALEEGLQTRIRRAAGGNPLYLEEMLAFVGARRTATRSRFPPTIQALLAARLDQLEPSERHVLERGSVEERFSTGRGSRASSRTRPRSTVGSSRSCARTSSGRSSASWRRGRLPLPPSLIRDAAYEALPKATRATSTSALQRWLRTRGPELGRARRDSWATTWSRRSGTGASSGPLTAG